MGAKVSTNITKDATTNSDFDPQVGDSLRTGGVQKHPYNKYTLIKANVQTKTSNRLRPASKPGHGRDNNLGVDYAISGQDNPMESTSPVQIRQKQLEDLRQARPQLSDQELEVISNTWKILQNHIAEVGSDIFERMFESYPDVKGAFGTLRSMSSEDNLYSQEIKAHGRRVLGTVELVITHSDNPEFVINHLHELGHKHITFNAKVEFMDLISQMFLFAVEPVLKDEWTPAAELAWAALFKFIIHLMKESMML